MQMTGMELVLDSRFAWFLAGKVAAAGSAVTLSPAGLAAQTLTSTTAGTVALNGTQLRIPLGGGTTFVALLFALLWLFDRSCLPSHVRSFVAV